MRLTDSDVAEIIRTLDDSPYDELELETEAFRLTLRRAGNPGDGWSQRRETLSAARHLDDARPDTAEVKAPKKGPGRVSPEAGETGLLEIVAPIVGTFYRAPAPGAPPFIEQGSMVDEDTVVAIIEVMKLMNSVPAGVAGEVAEICVANAELVEQGQCLFRVRPTAP